MSGQKDKINKILFVVPPFYGHFNASLSIGASLAEHGYAITWLSTVEIPGDLLPAGSGMLLPEKSLQQHAERIQWYNHKSDWIKDASLDEHMALTEDEMLHEATITLINEYREIIRCYQPEVVVVDAITCACNVGGFAAFAEGRPYITLWATPLEYARYAYDSKHLQKWRKWYCELLVKVQQTAGIESDSRVDLSTEMHLMLSIESFLGVSHFPDYYHLIGPAIQHRRNEREFDWSRLHNSTKPRVLVSLGTLLDEEAASFYKKIIDAYADQALTVVVSAEERLFDQWPENFIVSKYLPQVELMPYMDAVVCHGGYNTTVEALCYGLPLVVIPRAHDQFVSALRVVVCGCGLRLKYERFTVEQLVSSTQEILHMPKYKQASQMLGRAMLDAGGADKAVDLISQYIEQCQSPSSSAVAATA